MNTKRNQSRPQEADRVWIHYLMERRRGGPYATLVGLLVVADLTDFTDVMLFTQPPLTEYNI